MYQNKIRSPYRESSHKLPNDFFRHCYQGNFQKAKKEIASNVNIYQTFSDRRITPIMLAIHTNKEKLVNLLLEVYERDLEALKETNFKRAFVAFEVDLTEEFRACCIQKFTSEDQVEPVLLKSNNHEPPKVFFLRKQLKDKNDSCLQLMKKLQDKNGLCDLNWRYCWNQITEYISYGETYVYTVAYFGMANALKTLLANKTVDKIVNGFDKTPLHDAINRGKLDAVKVLLDYYKVSEDASSYLMQAATSRNQEMFEFIAEKLMETCGWSLKEIFSTKLDSSNNSLHLIAFSSSYEFFLNHKFIVDIDDVMVQNEEGDTMLHILAKENELENFTKLFLAVSKKFPKLLTVENCNRYLPLHLLAMNPCEDEVLLKETHQMTSKEIGHEKFLFESVEASLEFVEKLIEKGNSISMKFMIEAEKLDLIEHGNRLMQFSIKNSINSFKCFEFFLNHPSKINPNVFYEGKNAFLTAVEGADFYFFGYQAKHMIEMLTTCFKIDDVNAVDSLGNSILMYVVAFADMELVQYFMQLGADFNAVNNQGSTVLHFAVRNQKNDEVVRLLIDRGVKTQVINSQGLKAIEQAARYWNRFAFLTLLEDESDDELNRRYGEKQETLLHICAKSSKPHNLELLLERKLDFNAKDADGNLFIIKLFEHREQYILSVLEKMLSKKIPIDVNTKNVEGTSVFCFAVEIGGEVELEFLLKNFYDAIDFQSINNKQQTFAHKMFYNRRIHHWEKLFETFPALVGIMNQQMKANDVDGLTPLDYLIPSYFAPFLVSEGNGVPNFLLKFLEVDNFRHKFNLFTKDARMIEMIATKYPNFFEDFDELEKFVVALIHEKNSSENLNLILQLVPLEKLVTKWQGTESILHLLCERNDTSEIDFLLKHLNSNQLSILSHQLNGSGNVAKDLLNEGNKAIFGNCF